ncbi:MAG TPA: ferredoxin [Bacteroidales bacterium]|jgi:ferredoxin|nr:ferredoxin [Bacteroidales bacterium]
MALKNLRIEEGCTACGLCEDIAPDVFKVEDEAIILEGADIAANEEDIREAADACPVEVIVFDED